MIAAKLSAMNLTEERLGLPPRLTLLGLPLDPVNLKQASALLRLWTQRGEPRTVITLNSEFVIQARAEDALASGPSRFTQAMRAADLSTCDGVGIAWAAQRLLGLQVPRTPGFDLVTALLREGGPELRVFFLGGKPGVAQEAAANAARDYGVTVAGSHHGYFKPAEDERVARQVREARPHLLLTGMGAGRQEIFNDDWRELMQVPVSIGCGGVLDVLAGSAQLAPDWTRRAGLEWAWRVAGDRKRWGRAPRLAQFAALVLRGGH